MCEQCNTDNEWKFCPYCGHELRTEPQENKTGLTQDEFDRIFLGMLRNANKVVWYNSAGAETDIPTCRFILRNPNGEWMFDVMLDPAKPRFVYSFFRVHMYFIKHYGLEPAEIQRLMKYQLKRLFNMDGVTPRSQATTA